MIERVTRWMIHSRNTTQLSSENIKSLRDYWQWHAHINEDGSAVWVGPVHAATLFRSRAAAQMVIDELGWHNLAQAAEYVFPNEDT